MYLLIATLVVSYIAACFVFFNRYKLRMAWKLWHNLDNLQSDFTCEKLAHAMIFSYKKLGQSYQLYVPYNSNRVVDMAQYRVFLHDKDGNMKQLNQEPGIPFYVTAHDLNGLNIEVINDDNNKRHIYAFAEQPGYGHEVMD